MDFFIGQSEEIVGKPLAHLFVSEADERKILANVLLAGKTVNEEIPLKAKGGTYRNPDF